MRESKHDERILEYATDRQKEYFKAVWEQGSLSKAAKFLGIGQRTIERGMQLARSNAARHGYSPEHDLITPVPDGFLLKGQSAYYNKDGVLTGRWVKSNIDHQRQLELLKETVLAFSEDLPKVKRRPVSSRTKYSKELLAAYPIGDAHIGMRAWKEEVGEEWDLQLAEEIHCSAMSRLIEQSPRCEQAVIVNLGDFLHYDNMAGVTSRSGHHLDISATYAEMARVAVKVLRQAIESALQRHKTVHVINVLGNHDDVGARWLAICLSEMYSNEPRVQVETQPSEFHYFRHGKVLLGFHHGHSCKPDSLPGVMATDRARDWGETEWRYWWLGHVHHQSVKDYAGCSVESFRTLASRDKYAHNSGYRSPRDMKAIILDRDYGEVNRQTVNPSMFLPRAA